MSSAATARIGASFFTPGIEERGAPVSFTHPALPPHHTNFCLTPLRWDPKLAPCMRYRGLIERVSNARKALHTA